jgi:hypothetical protein
MSINKAVKDMLDLIDKQRAEIVALRAELNDEQKAHQIIADICFSAGVDTGDGTSIDAVKRLRARLEAAEKLCKAAEVWSNQLSEDHGYPDDGELAQAVLAWKKARGE